MAVIYAVSYADGEEPSGAAKPFARLVPAEPACEEGPR